MATIMSRGAASPQSGVTLNLSNAEALLVLSLLHPCSFRTYGNSYAFHAFTLSEKLTDVTGITPGAAVQIVQPSVNLYDHVGNYLASYEYNDFRVIFK